MVLSSEQERVRTLIADTVSLLCKNGLHYTKEFCIEGLLGITLDRDQVFLVNIKELVKTENWKESSDSERASGDETSSKSPAKRRKRTRSKPKANNGSAETGAIGVDGSDEDNDSDTSTLHQTTAVTDGETQVEPPLKRLDVKQEINDDNSDEDLVFVKDEPASDMGSFNVSAQSDSMLGDLSQGQLYATPLSESVPNAAGWDGSPASFNPSMSRGHLPAAAVGSQQTHSVVPIMIVPNTVSQEAEPIHIDIDPAVSSHMKMYQPEYSSPESSDNVSNKDERNYADGTPALLPVPLTSYKQKLTKLSRNEQLQYRQNVALRMRKYRERKQKVLHVPCLTEDEKKKAREYWRQQKRALREKKLSPGDQQRYRDKTFVMERRYQERKQQAVNTTEDQKRRFIWREQKRRYRDKRKRKFATVIKTDDK